MQYSMIGKFKIGTVVKLQKVDRLNANTYGHIIGFSTNYLDELMLVVQFSETAIPENRVRRVNPDSVIVLESE